MYCKSFRVVCEDVWGGPVKVWYETWPTLDFTGLMGAWERSSQLPNTNARKLTKRLPDEWASERIKVRYAGSDVWVCCILNSSLFSNHMAAVAQPLTAWTCLSSLSEAGESVCASDWQWGAKRFYERCTGAHGSFTQPLHPQETDNYRLHYVLWYHVRKYSDCTGLLNALLQHVFQL